MNARRLIVVFVLLFMFFLGIYTWNERTSKLDTISTNIGLEVAGFVVRSVVYVSTTVSDFWNNYISLVGVNEENKHLKEELFNAKRELASAKEEKAELDRLRKLLSIDYAVDWKAEGVRILAWRLGANDFFDSFVLSKGFFSGSKVGTPIINADGLIGRVLKAGPYTSVALLLTDSGSSVSVITENGRVPGIVQGNGHNQLLSMRFVKKNEEVKVGERILTSGLDLSSQRVFLSGKLSALNQAQILCLKFR
jgi:rod shape-determining protein MreC